MLVKIAVLDGFTLNPGDNPWTGLEELGDVEVYDRTSPGELIERAKDVDILVINKVRITEEGLRHSIRVGIQYVEAWLAGNGCVPLYNLMEDAATAEICRAQLWQCVHHGLKTDDGQDIGERFDTLLDEELAKIADELGHERFRGGKFTAAAQLFGDMVRKAECDEFLTLPAYEKLP